MLLEHLDLAAIAPQALTLEADLVMVRRVSDRLELEDRAFRAKSVEGRQVVAEAANARRFVHGFRELPRSGGAALSLGVDSSDAARIAFWCDSGRIGRSSRTPTLAVAAGHDLGVDDQMVAVLDPSPRPASSFRAGAVPPSL